MQNTGSREDGQLPEVQILIRQALDANEEQKGTLSGKIANFMTKLIPVANFALSIISLSADVSLIVNLFHFECSCGLLGSYVAGILPVKYTAKGLTQLLTVCLLRLSFVHHTKC
jgi:hypothetical protein